SCRHAFGAGLDVEQRENLLLRQAQRRRCAVLLDQLMKELTFLIQDLSDALFDRAHGDKARHKDGITLADAVRSVDSLVLDGGVPPAVKQEYIVGKLQVQADAAG